MSDQYLGDHAGALADVTAAGARVVFTSRRRTAEDAAGVSAALMITTVTGYAIEDDGDAEEYTRLGLTTGEAPRLFVVATPYGPIPPVGATVLWGGVPYMVRSSKPFRPAGQAVFTYVIIAR